MESHLQAARNVNATELKTHAANATNPPVTGSLCGPAPAETAGVVWAASARGSVTAAGTKPSEMPAHV